MLEETRGGGAEDERFAEGASRYADYLLTTEGRLRLDAAWANLKRFADAELLRGVGGEYEGRALDAGGGTGALALRLAAEGWEVAVLDSSRAMLDLAAEAASREGLAERVSLQQSDAGRAAELFDRGSFDLVACHNVLEYVAEPERVVAALTECVRPNGLVSLLARNRAGEVLRAAVKARDFGAAREALTAEEVRESLYGGPARLFDARTLGALLDEGAWEVVGVCGVRVFADYLPPELSTAEEGYAGLLSLEIELGARPEFAAVARYTQLFARRR
ncbi:MAG TPA: methyltransferase [Pyrinomonadaceae bacterium]|nr:methyltransferase [Pyrinomonadaceae bacterium]